MLRMAMVQITKIINKNARTFTTDHAPLRPKRNLSGWITHSTLAKNLRTSPKRRHTNAQSYPLVNLIACSLCYQDEP